jgi:SAM-dependent methyltransferase
MKEFKKDFYDTAYYQERHTTIDPYLDCILTNYVFKSKRGINVLDAGCGSGVYVNYMRAKNIKAWGIDFSGEASRISGQINASVFKMPFTDNSFDIVLSVHTIEHLTDEGLNNFLAECRRVLKNNGRLFIMTPNGISPGRIILGRKWFPDPSHINIQNPFRLKRTLKRNEFCGIRNIFFLPLNKIRRRECDIVKYYGLDCIFRRLPVLQDIIFFLIYSTPLVYFRDVLYVLATIRK